MVPSAGDEHKEPEPEPARAKREAERTEGRDAKGNEGRAVERTERWAVEKIDELPRAGRGVEEGRQATGGGATGSGAGVKEDEDGDNNDDIKCYATTRRILCHGTSRQPYTQSMLLKAIEPGVAF